MKSNYSRDFILQLISKQLSFFLINEKELELIEATYPDVLERVKYCFLATKNKYYFKDGETFFNPFHSGQWCIFLYFLSNTLYKKDLAYSTTCDKIYYLNKMLNGVDLFYEVNLPDIFMLDHPLGSVIGRGTFSNYFSFSQGNTIGNNKGIYPVLGNNVKLLSNSKVIGNSHIGDNVIIAANTYVKDQNVESNLIVFGSSPNLIFKPKKND